MPYGFSLVRLTLTGEGVPPAEIGFEEGLNVVAGPSNTGKTFIAECLEFMTGGGSPPRPIELAKAYDRVHLRIRSRRDGREFDLDRDLHKAGKIRLTSPDEDNQSLEPKHNKNKKNTISHFLLELSGLEGRSFRKNARGTTQALSFRDLARFTFIDEEDVITGKSPLLSGQHISKTVEKNIFRFLLTGLGETAESAPEDPGVTKVRIAGRIGAIDEIRKSLQDKLMELDLDFDPAELPIQVARAIEDSKNASQRMVERQEVASQAEGRRRQAWASLKEVESQLAVSSELQSRFELLERQYQSDLDRLAAITEASSGLDKMEEERCPVCGAPAENHDPEHVDEAPSPTDIIESCRAEASKTERLRKDLQETIESNRSKVELLNQKRSTERDRLQEIDLGLEGLLRPKLAEAVEQYQEAQASIERNRAAIHLIERIAELNDLADAAPREEQAEPGDDTGSLTTAGEAEQFTQRVEALLREWNFPGLDRVTFSEEDQDIVISGTRRADHGKGVRAITHAAFNLGLLRLCVDEDRPFPSFVLIDSPLVVYREPDPDEGDFPAGVKDAFWRSVSNSYQDAQVIVLENDEPPVDVDQSANVIHFTGAGTGRGGFLPQGEN